MTFQELMNCIKMSSANDWHVIGRPTYRDKWNVGERDGRLWIKVESHDSVAVYKPDISITMAWGLTDNADFQEPWANQFPDPHASIDSVDVFANGALVFRETYVSVDGCRAYLPIPRRAEAHVIPADYARFVRLLNALSFPVSQWDRYFTEAKFTEIDSAPWPREKEA